jgi:micrococcal nuclease
MSSVRNRFLTAILILVAVMLYALTDLKLSDFTPQSRERFNPRPNPEQQNASEEPCRVARVLDGDTVVLKSGETVRLIGVDAPELHHPNIPVQRFAKESMAFLRRQAEGRDCALEFEPGQLRDRFGRLLAYFFIDHRLINAELIRQGYAYAYTRFPYHRQSEFMALEQEARQARVGLWKSQNLKPISWRDATKHYGEYATVEGTVAAARNTGKACFLNFHPDYKRHFTAVIFASDFSHFPKNPETFYKGKTVRVTGVIKEYKGKPEIVLEDPSQIEIVN